MKIPKAKSGMPEHKNGKKNIWTSIFFVRETMFEISIMESDATAVSIAAVFFYKSSYYNSYTWSKTSHLQLSKVILSGIYNRNLEAIN